jgi:hypothetical protein
MHGDAADGTKEQMVVMEMNAAHVPMNILCLHVKCKDVGEQVTQSNPNLPTPPASVA